MGHELPTYEFEKARRAEGYARIAGVDEAGRGPLAGPVVSAAVVLDPASIPAGLADSKKLTARRREALFDEIRTACTVGVGIATVAEIDSLNILRAAHLSMCRAIADAGGAAFCLIDGNLVPEDCPAPAEAVVKGDARCLSIAAASIIAKVTRDRIMVGLAQQYPGYGWEKNAGYPTKAHVAALEDLGVTPEHRRSFAPVHNILCREKSVSP
ncbi:ribonuclease HII [Ovoidimarina sediminis]|uniref:ribonuclease HII n=1 Tax=Ovoidimarina sediminis TaxID=3079856 RepID=UPI00290E9791|nr:ribonuclease HII [Rhodophyticola sp. MJ-SS7]MDU8942565.1 ribonuclease HII [Rhodophyticola sp. MJ-SS7]